MEKRIYKTKEEVPLILFPEDLMGFGFSRSQSYRIFKLDDVPKFKINSRCCIFKEDFFKWISQKANKNVPHLNLSDNIIPDGKEV